MTKEFENFKGILKQKQNELEIQARAIKKAQDNEVAKKQAEDRQKQIESDQKAAENKKILEDSGVISLFQKIIENKIVPDGRIEYGKEYGSVFLLFNKRETSGSGDDLGSISYDICAIQILSNGKIGTIRSVKDPESTGTRIVGGVSKGSYNYTLFNAINIETPIDDLDNYVADKIVHPDNKDTLEQFSAIRIESYGWVSRQNCIQYWEM